MTDMAKIQDLLQFAPTDLPYNRRGERSPAQIAAWEASEKGCARNFFWLFLALAVVTAVLTVLISGKDRGGVLFVGGLFSVLAFGGWLLMRSPTEGIEKVYSITGPARLGVDRGDKGSKSYVMMIDKIDFTVSPGLYDLLEHETVYTAHYQKLGRVHRLLSLETPQ